MASCVWRRLVHLGTFDYTVWVVFTTDHAAIARFARRKLGDLEITAAHFAGRRGCVLKRGDYIPILWMPRRPRTPVEYGTFAHEAFHVVAHAMRWANIPFTEESEEAYTHTLAKLVREVLGHA